MSSVDLERVCVREVSAVHEAAAVGVPTPGGGPDRLVLFVVLEQGATSTDANGAGSSDADGLKALRVACQAAIRSQLNPLFKLDQVIVVDALPRTASNKVMRRTLRDGLRASAKSRL